MYPVVLHARLVAAVHAHRQAHWQVGDGFLGLPHPNGIPKLDRPACYLCAETCSPPRVAAFGTAARWAWHGIAIKLP